jgi:hypothetical protein
MSEYQYYEFRTLARMLTREEMAELRKVSSRGLISPTSFVNEYEWGDFKGDPDEWMDRYFDAFLYYANWGQKTFKLKIPRSLVSAEAISQYQNPGGLTGRTRNDSTIITFDLAPDDPPDEWEENEGAMGYLIGLRAEIAQGDHRCLYLGWLIGRGTGDVVAGSILHKLEPPVPRGLQELTASQQALVDFFEIDLDLLSAAAEASPAIVQPDRESRDLQAWIAKIEDSAKAEYLLRVINGAGVDVALELNARFIREIGLSDLTSEPPRRTVVQLHQLAMNIREARITWENERREATKKRKLDDLLARLPAVWAEIEDHSDTKKTNHYNLAVELLLDVRELARRGDVPDFTQRIADFRVRHSTKRALLDRMKNARL